MERELDTTGREGETTEDGGKRACEATVEAIDWTGVGEDGIGTGDVEVQDTQNASISEAVTAALGQICLPAALLF